MYRGDILHWELGTNLPSRQATRPSSDLPVRQPYSRFRVRVLSPLELVPNSHPLSAPQVHTMNGHGGLSHGLALEHSHAAMTASVGFDVGAYTAGSGSNGGGGGGGGAFDALSGFAQPLGVVRESASKEAELNELGGVGGGGGGADADAMFPLSGMAAGGLQQFASGGGMHHNFPPVRFTRLVSADGAHRCPHPFSATKSKHMQATRSLCGDVRCGV